MKRCVTAFSTVDRTVAAGTLVEDNDELVKGHEEFFVDVSAEPQAAVIPGTDKVGDNAQPDDEGGLPVSTQSGAAALEEQKATEAEAKDADKAKTGDRPADRRANTQDAPVEQATAAPGEKRNTGRRS